jgi:selenocysteine lyase/cysteine desulfurase
MFFQDIKYVAQRAWDFIWKESWLNKLPAYQGGGEMIKDVSWETTYADSINLKPERLAGGIVLELPSIIWTKLALKIFKKTRTWIRLWNQTLVRNWRFENIWYSKRETSVISFNIEGIHPYDIGTIIDKLGIAVRTGHHCATDYDFSIFQEQYELLFFLQYQRRNRRYGWSGERAACCS